MENEWTIEKLMRPKVTSKVLQENCDQYPPKSRWRTFYKIKTVVL